MNEEVVSTGITLEGASLPFVLIGPAGDHRRVLVRSHKATLDLIGLDSLLDESSLRQPMVFDILNLGLRHTASRHIVRSSMTVAINGDDSRTSFYSFAWRGFATQSDQRKINNFLDYITKDLEVALKRKRIDDIEFILSPLILLCESISEKHAGARGFNLMALVLGAIGYAAITAWFLIERK